MQAMRALLIAFSPYITEEWKYGIPLYYYKAKCSVTSGHKKIQVALSWYCQLNCIKSSRPDA